MISDLLGRQFHWIHQADRADLSNPSGELVSDSELTFPKQWADDPSWHDLSRQSDAADYETKFPQAVALIKKAENMKASVEPEDAEDMELLSERLKKAMAADDEAAVATYSQELDDILFYVE